MASSGKAMGDRFPGLKVALVHDWLVSRGGGERVLYDLHLLFPKAPIYTLVYDAEKAPRWLQSCDVRTTYLQDIPQASRHHQMLLPLMPRAWEAIDLSEFDLVISTCSSCCKGVITHPDALHICYCFSPTRYLWDMHYEYLNNTTPVKRLFASWLMPNVRAWDYQAAQRPDYFVADSEFVAKRIKKYYGRESTVIYPAVPVRRVAPDRAELSADGYYLVVSRLVHYKRIDLAVQACNSMNRVLVVAGVGEEEAKLRGLAGPGTVFAGRASDDRIDELFAGAKALLFPGVEDFGIVPLEAMSSGVPVIAYGKGGALETVHDGQNGLLFHEQSVEGLVAAIQQFEAHGIAWSPQQMHDYSQDFSREVFQSRMMRFIEGKLSSLK